MITKYNKSIFALVASLLLMMAGCDDTTSSPTSQAPDTKDLNNVTLWKTFEKTDFGTNVPDEILAISESVAFAAGAQGLYYYGDDQWKKVPLEGKNPAQGNKNETLPEGEISHLTKLSDGRVVFVHKKANLAIAKPDGSGLDEVWLGNEHGTHQMTSGGQQITSIAALKGADDKEAVLITWNDKYVTAQFDGASPKLWDYSIGALNDAGKGKKDFTNNYVKLMPSPNADALYICRADGCLKLEKNMIKTDGYTTTKETTLVIRGRANAVNTWRKNESPAHWSFTGKANNIVFSYGTGVGFKSALKARGRLVTADHDLSAKTVKQLVRVGSFIHVVSDDVIYRANDEGKADDKIYLDTATGFMWASADDLAQKTESELASFSEKLTGLKRYAVEGNVSWYVLGDKVLMSKTGDIKVKNN